MNLLLTLGEHKKSIPSLAVLDWDSGKITDRFAYQSPSFPELPSNSFRGGMFYRGLFYVCTFNEVLAVDVTDWTVNMTLSEPAFNDLHDVHVDDTGIWVCSTGLEVVEHYTHDLKLVERYVLSGRSRLAGAGPSQDYRLQEIDKRTFPREHHINNITRLQDQVLVTHGKSESVRTLSGEVLVDELPGMPHDGTFFGGHMYLTIVKGYVEVFQCGTWERVASYNLNECYGKEQELGWCRGLAVDDEGMYVGFTQFRDSKATDYTRWIRRKPGRLPSRVVRYHFSSRSIAGECVLRSRVGNTTLLYGVYAVPTG